MIQTICLDYITSCRFTNRCSSRAMIHTGGPTRRGASILHAIVVAPTYGKAPWSARIALQRLMVLQTALKPRSSFVARVMSMGARANAEQCGQCRPVRSTNSSNSQTKQSLSFTLTSRKIKTAWQSRYLKSAVPFFILL